MAYFKSTYETKKVDFDLSRFHKMVQKLPTSEQGLVPSRLIGEVIRAYAKNKKINSFFYHYETLYPHYVKNEKVFKEMAEKVLSADESKAFAYHQRFLLCHLVVVEAG